MAERIAIEINRSLFDMGDFSYAVAALEDATHSVRLLALSIEKDCESVAIELWRIHLQMERSAEVARAFEAKDWSKADAAPIESEASNG